MSSTVEPALLIDVVEGSKEHMCMKRGFDSPPIVSVELVVVSRKEDPSVDSILLASTPCENQADFVGYAKGEGCTW